MKKSIMTFLLLLTTLTLAAPPITPTAFISTAITLRDPHWIDYTPLADAISYFETGNRPLHNIKEDAVGYFQIRECRVKDYNIRLGSHFKHEDFYNYDKSLQMFLYYAQGKSFERAAKDWNGSGPMTEIYWGKIKKLIKNT